MQHVLSVALVAMHQDMQRMDSVASNLANVSTTAYKREIVAARPFVDAMAAAASSETAEAGSSVPVPGSMAVLWDSSPGTLKSTGQPFDVAITGQGFFEVNTDHGPAYTRQGNFHLDMRGRLVTAQGDPVMGKGGEIYLTTPAPVIDAAGNISEPASTNGPSIGTAGPSAQLKVVQFDKSSDMQRLGAGLMAAGSGMTVAGDGEVQMRQGALENANVSSMQEMVHLMQTMRHFESMQKVAQGYDEMVGTAIHKLGDLS